MAIECIIVNHRVQVREIVRNKKCSYLDYHRQHLKKIRRIVFGNILAYEQNPKFQKTQIKYMGALISLIK
jgi:hypothetical protein